MARSSSKSSFPVIHLWVTQGKTDHMATLEEPSVAQLLWDHQKKDDDHDPSLPITEILDIDPDTDVRVRWSSNNQRDVVTAKEIRIRDLEREGRGSERIGRPQPRTSRRRKRGSSESISRPSKRRRNKSLAALVTTKEEPVESSLAAAHSYSSRDATPSRNAPRQHRKQQQQQQQEEHQEEQQQEEQHQEQHQEEQQEEQQQQEEEVQHQQQQQDEPSSWDHSKPARQESLQTDQPQGSSRTPGSVNNNGKNYNNNNNNNNKDRTSQELFTYHNQLKKESAANVGNIEAAKPPLEGTDTQYHRAQQQIPLQQQEQQQQREIDRLLEQDFDSSDDEAVAVRMELRLRKKALSEGTAMRPNSGRRCSSNSNNNNSNSSSNSNSNSNSNKSKNDKNKNRNKNDIDNNNNNNRVRRISEIRPISVSHAENNAARDLFSSKATEAQETATATAKATAKAKATATANTDANATPGATNLSNWDRMKRMFTAAQWSETKRSEAN